MPFDIENCVRYDSNYLKGYTSERRDTNIEQLSKVSHLSKEENYFKWEKITYNEKYQQNKITNADKALLKTLPA